MKKLFNIHVITAFIIVIFIEMFLLVYFSAAIAQIGPDDYEPDNTPDDAKRILITFVDVDNTQGRTFHNLTDVDWVFFYAHEKQIHGDDPQRYNIKVMDYLNEVIYTVLISLWDPNNLFIPIKKSFGTIIHEFPRDGYYFLKIEQPSDPNERVTSYNLKVEIIEAVKYAAISGRVVDENGKGINGIRVEFIPQHGNFSIFPSFTGSLKNGKVDVFDEKISEGWLSEGWLSEGWYFTVVSTIDYYYLKVFAKDAPQPNKERAVITLKSYQVNFVPDIVLPNISGDEKDAVSGYERVVKSFGFDYYPLNEDKDKDGLSNIEEFLYSTNPRGPSYKCFLYQGLNLVPFYSLDNYFSYYSVIEYFCPINLEVGDAIWEYNQESFKWNSVIKKDSKNCKGSNFNLNNCSSYLIYYKNTYKVIPQVILQDNITETCLEPLKPGLNLKWIPIQEEQKGKYTSYKYLFESRSEKVQSISRYKAKSGKWESAYHFFGQPGGVKFIMLPRDAYLIMVEENK